MEQRLKYIEEAGIVDDPAGYLYSGAGAYWGIEVLLEIHFC